MGHSDLGPTVCCGSDRASGLPEVGTSGQQCDVEAERSAGIVGGSTVELQSPTGFTGIYSYWDSEWRELWDFGAATEYPRLRIDYDGDVPAILEKPAPTPTPCSNSNSHSYASSNSNAYSPADAYSYAS